MFLLHLLRGFFIFIFVLLGVAFYTFIERKFLGFFHFRFGPNKVFFGGFQPFSDALRLFLKFGFKIKYFNYYIYCFMPLIGLLLMLIFWVFYPFYGGFCFRNIGFLFFFCVRGIGVYFFLIRGWRRGRRYSYYGAYRSSAQSISYEVIMVLVFLYLCIS